MEQALTIFFAGIAGVLLGMAVLYVAILISHTVTNQFENKKDKG